MVVGEELQCSSSCHQVPITLANTLFSIRSFVLPITGAGIVLGIQLLQTLRSNLQIMQYLQRNSTSKAVKLLYKVSLTIIFQKFSQINKWLQNANSVSEFSI